MSAMTGVLSYLVFFLCVVLVLCILTMGLNLQWGFTGLFNAGVAGFYAIGGYTHAILTAAPNPQLMGNYGLPWIVGILGAVLLTALAAAVIGLITIRLRGDYLAIATFGIGIMIQLVALNLERWSGGSQGITRIAKPMRLEPKTNDCSRNHTALLPKEAAATSSSRMARNTRPQGEDKTRSSAQYTKATTASRKTR